jgi:hypothetical protein
MSTLGLLAIARHDVSMLIAVADPLFNVLILQAGRASARLAIYSEKSYLVFAPLLLWTVFSVIYYGAPFPNTAYAKMLHGIPRADLIDFVSSMWQSV